MARWPAPSPRLVDAAIAAGLAVWALPDLPWPWRPPGHVPPLPTSAAVVALFLLQTLPFLWRRRFPGLVLGASLVALAGRSAMHLDLLSALAAAFAGAYAAGRFGGGWVRVAARALVGAALVVGMVALLRQPRVLALPYALYAALILVGEGERHRHEAFASAIADEATAERLRIARELHDVLAHQLSLIALHAGAARLVARDHPERVSEAIHTIETTARDAAGELGTLLGVLRQDPPHAARHTPPEPGQALLAPQPALTDVAGLVGRARAAGLPVTLSVEGTPEPMPASVQASVYRIVQEALTNVAKHAGSATTTVRLDYRSDELAVEILDDGSHLPPRVAAPGREVARHLVRERRAPAHPGYGLAGMAERVRSYGGSLEAGPRPDRGFAVRATIPRGDPS